MGNGIKNGKSEIILQVISWKWEMGNGKSQKKSGIPVWIIFVLVNNYYRVLVVSRKNLLWKILVQSSMIKLGPCAQCSSLKSKGEPMRSTRCRSKIKRMKREFKERKVNVRKRRLKGKDSWSYNNKRMKNRKLKLNRWVPMLLSKPWLHPLVPTSHRRLLKNQWLKVRL